MAAIERGLELPAIEKEAERRTWNVQRYLLIAGWSFIFAGVAVFLAITTITAGIPQGQISSGLPVKGSQYLGIIPLGVGIAHLITYYAGRNRE